MSSSSDSEESHLVVNESRSPSPLDEEELRPKCKFVIEECKEETRKKNRSCTVCKLHGLTGKNHQKNSSQCPFFGHEKCYICSKKEEYNPETPELIPSTNKKRQLVKAPEEPIPIPLAKIPKLSETSSKPITHSSPLEKLSSSPSRPKPLTGTERIELYSLRDIRDRLTFITNYSVELSAAVRRLDDKWLAAKNTR